MSSTTDMLENLGYFGKGEAPPEEPRDLREGPDEPSATAAAATPDTAPASEGVSLAEALAAEGLASETVPQETAAAEEQPASASEEEPEPSKLEKLEAEIADLRRQNEELLAVDAEEQFEADWEGVVEEGVAFYRGLMQKIRDRGITNGRTQSEINAVIKHMVYDGNEIERLGAEPGTPGLIEWQQETLLNYADAKARRGAAKPQKSELEYLTETYGLTDDDQATLRKFVNYPPEAREEIAKTLGAKNAKATTKKDAAAEVASDRVAARLSQQAPPGVPGPAEKKKDYQYTHAPGVKRQETRLFAQRLGLMR